MMDVTNKVGRSRQDPPTEPGWYYGRPKIFNLAKEGGLPMSSDQIFPDGPLVIDVRPVYGSTDTPVMLVADVGMLVTLDRVDWFGPVPECFELKV